MKPFDLRHRWGPIVHDGGRIKRTCSACGRTDAQEILISDAMIEVLATVSTGPNPYRAMIFTKGPA